MCAACQRTAQGVIYCEEHAPVEAGTAAAPEPPAAPPPETAANAACDCSPGLALGLGFIPGVGAIYNGQYAKGLVHAVVFGMLVSIASSDAVNNLGALFGFLIPAWVFYMAIEAYHTARKRRAGIPVDEFSSLVNLHGRKGTFPTGAVILILLGGVLLLNTLDILQFRYIVRYWPVLLILAGVYMLFLRFAPGSNSEER